MSMAIVTSQKGEGRTLKAGGAWIYDNEIESIMGNAENGEIVLVHDFDGYPLGRGFVELKSGADDDPSYRHQHIGRRWKYYCIRRP